MSKVSSPPILNRESMTDAPEGEWFDKILDYGNGFNDQVAKALRNGVTLSDNTPYKTQSYILKHGVETEIVPPLARGLSCRGVSVLQCEGVEVGSTTQKPTGKVYSLGLGSPIVWRPSGKDTGSIYVTAQYDGNIGEQVRSYRNRAGYVAAATTNVYELASIQLAAGTWDINAFGGVFSSVGTLTDLYFAVHTTSAALPTLNTSDADFQTRNTGFVINQELNIAIPQYRVTPTTTTTYYFNARANFGSGSVGLWGRISAVRAAIDPATTGRVNMLFYGE